MLTYVKPGRLTSQLQFQVFVIERAGEVLLGLRGPLSGRLFQAYFTPDQADGALGSAPLVGFGADPVGGKAQGEAVGGHILRAFGQDRADQQQEEQQDPFHRQRGLPGGLENGLPMVNKKAEILSGIGLGGLLLGQSLQGLAWEQQWSESEGIVRGTLEDGAVLVTGDEAADRIVGLEAQTGYLGELPGGLHVGLSLTDAQQRMPQLRSHDMLSGLYEPERLGFLLLGDETVESILVCDFGHDYWTFARPLLEEEEEYDS